MRLTAIAVQKTRQADSHDEWFAVHVKENNSAAWRRRGTDLRADEALRTLVDLGLAMERAVDLMRQARTQYDHQTDN